MQSIDHEFIRDELQVIHGALMAVTQLVEPTQRGHHEDLPVERCNLSDLLLVIHRDFARTIERLNSVNKSANTRSDTGSQHVDQGSMHPREVAAAIVQAGTTQTAIAHHLGVSPSSVTKVICKQIRSQKIEAELQKITGKEIYAKPPGKPGRKKSVWTGRIQHAEVAA